MIPVLKGFRSTPDKFCLCGITTAMLAGGQYPVSAGNHLKRHNPGGGQPPPGYITERYRIWILLPQFPLLRCQNRTVHQCRCLRQLGAGHAEHQYVRLLSQ